MHAPEPMCAIILAKLQSSNIEQFCFKFCPLPVFHTYRVIIKENVIIYQILVELFMDLLDNYLMKNSNTH